MVKSRASASRRPRTRPASDRPDQRVAEMIDLASDAKVIAEGLGELFLSYLLAMAIQEMNAIAGSRAAQVADDRSVKSTSATRTD